MSTFRVTITRPSPSIDSPLPPDQFFSPTVESARAELKKWATNGHHGKYKVVEVVEVEREEGEC